MESKFSDLEWNQFYQYLWEEIESIEDDLEEIDFSSCNNGAEVYRRLIEFKKSADIAAYIASLWHGFALSSDGLKAFNHCLKWCELAALLGDRSSMKYLYETKTKYRKHLAPYDAITYINLYIKSTQNGWVRKLYTLKKQRTIIINLLNVQVQNLLRNEHEKAEFFLFLPLSLTYVFLGYLANVLLAIVTVFMASMVFDWCVDLFSKW